MLAQSKFPFQASIAHLLAWFHEIRTHWLPSIAEMSNSEALVPTPQRPYLPPYMQQKPPGSPPESLHGSLPDRPLQSAAFGALQNGYHQSGYHSGSDAGGGNGSRARKKRKHVPWPVWGPHSLTAALAASALAADGVPAGWAIAQSAVASVADAGRVLLPGCLVAAGKGGVWACHRSMIARSTLL